jgi:ABC-type multidrug transport system ATPase subunit
MDEPTAHIDPDTDAKLQKVIREDFSGATLVTIAHRLHTVADFDRIVVMGAGTAMECGAPSALLTAGDGHFASMVRMLGRDAAATIMQKARSAHKANRGPSDTASALEVADCASQDTAVVPHSEPPVGAEAAWCGCTGVGV